MAVPETVGADPKPSITLICLAGLVLVLLCVIHMVSRLRAVPPAALLAAAAANRNAAEAPGARLKAGAMRPRVDAVPEDYVAPTPYLLGGSRTPSFLPPTVSTEEVDPLITGHLYDYADGLRNVYAARTAHGSSLREFSSSGGKGDVGYDIGPYGLYEYGGKAPGEDDGIPEKYAFPATPVRWYRPRMRDYYGPEGPTPYTDGLYTLTEPDHDPLM